ncbi:MAG: hypothetical protein R3228_09480 [Halioglobus sp.]|nr:hypothetical protein [Halioglobus sp.]
MEPGLRQVSWGLGALAISLPAVFFLMTMAIGSGTDATPSDLRKPLDAAAFRVLSGGAETRDGTLRFNSFTPFADAHHALAVWSGNVDAAQLPFLSYRSRVIDNRTSINLTWRRADDPDEVHGAALPVNAAGISAVNLSASPAWRGDIVEVGILVVAQAGDTAASVSDLALESHSRLLVVRALVTQWTAFRGWTHRSLNYLRSHPGENGISALPYAAMWSALAALTLLALGRFAGNIGGIAFAVTFFVPWIALDMLWQRELLTQLDATKQRFEGVDMAQRHLADEDSAIYGYATRLKREFLPERPARVFLFDSATGHDYRRLKTQFYLLPHNIYNFGNRVPRPALRRGDYVLVLGGNGEPTFDAATSQLVWSRGPQAQAVELDAAAAGRLYQLTDPALESRGDG